MFLMFPRLCLFVSLLVSFPSCWCISQKILIENPHFWCNSTVWRSNDASSWSAHLVCARYRWCRIHAEGARRPQQAGSGIDLRRPYICSSSRYKWSCPSRCHTFSSAISPHSHTLQVFRSFSSASRRWWSKFEWFSRKFYWLWIGTSLSPIQLWSPPGKYTHMAVPYWLLHETYVNHKKKEQWAAHFYAGCTRSGSMLANVACIQLKQGLTKRWTRSTCGGRETSFTHSHYSIVQSLSHRLDKRNWSFWILAQIVI